MMGQIEIVLRQQWLLVLAACLLFCVVGGLIIFFIRKRKMEDKPFIMLDEEVHIGGGLYDQMEGTAFSLRPKTSGDPRTADPSVRWMSDELLDPISRRIQEYPETDLKSCRLVLQDLDRPGQVYQANVAERITIGRRTSCTITIPDRTMSGEHCQVLLRDGKLYIRDLQSTNGTYLNRSTSRVNEEELKSGDILRMGSVRSRVRISVIRS